MRARLEAGTPILPLPRIHAWDKPCLAVILVIGSTTIKRSMKSLPSFVRPVIAQRGYWNLPVTILANISSLVSPLKGIRCVRRKNVITPTDHRSHSLPYLRLTISGATDRTEPANAVMGGSPGL